MAAIQSPDVTLPWMSPSSPSAVREPLPSSSSAQGSPVLTRRGIIDAASRGWGSGPSSPAQSRSSAVVEQVIGAEGGKDAIQQRRRGSNSFKAMSTGSVVSNSPFAKMMSSNAAPPPLPQTAAAKLYGAPRSPSKQSQPTFGFGGGRTATSPIKRSVSGSSVNSIDENEPPASAGPAPPVSSSPFRPTKPASSGSLNTTVPLSPTAFRPTRPASSKDVDDLATRVGMAALSRTRAVSNSPWASPTSSAATISPPLVPAPYEISAIATESAPFDQYSARDVSDIPIASTSLPKGRIPSVGLGIRPGGAPSTTSERRITGASQPPPMAPPAGARYNSPSSSLAGMRCGMTGPRPPSAADELDDTDDEGDTTARDLDASMEAAEQRRILRRKASTKTVTWAEMEDVVVFETEDRRASDVSQYSSQSDRSASSDDSDRYEEDLSFDRSTGSLNFAEGGSIEVHDLPRQSSTARDDVSDVSLDDEASAVDEMLEELTGNIDTYLREADVYSPSLINNTSPSLPNYDRTAFSAVSDSDDAASTVVSGYEQFGIEPEAPSTRPLSPSNSRSGSPIKAQIVFAPQPALSSSTATVTGPATFDLPDIPGTSPFLGFDDDGAASSVVTLDMAPTANRPTSMMSERPSSTGVNVDHRPTTPVSQRITEPTSELTPTSAARGPSQSTPTGRHRGGLMASPILDDGESGAGSPIIGAFGGQSPTIAGLRSLQGSPQRSPFANRAQAGSEVGSSSGASGLSWYGSVSSVRSSRTGGRERLEEQMRAHQAMLERAASSSGTGSITSPSMNGDSLSSRSSPFTSPDLSAYSPKSITVALPASPAFAIPARPANRVLSATISGSMVEAGSAAVGRKLEIGTPFDHDLAGEMDSPLERLQRGIGQQHRSRPRRSLSMSEIEDRPAGVADEDEAEEGNDTISGIPGSGERQKQTLPISMPSLANLSQPGNGHAFWNGLKHDIDAIYEHRDSKYRVRESKVIIRADDTATVGNAGDVDTGFLRKKRQSDAHALLRNNSVLSVGGSSSTSSSKRTGQVFVKLVEASFDNLPLPSKQTAIVCHLDNGAANVEAGRFTLASKVLINKEFELTCPEDGGLSFSIDFRVPAATLAAAQAAITLSSPAPPPSPSKSPGGFRSIFSSPKKRSVSKPVPTPAPEPYLAFVGKDGKLGVSIIDFKAEMDKCKHKLAQFVIPFQHIGFTGNGGQRTCAGGLKLEMLYVPAIAHVSKKDLPRSMDEVRVGLQLAEWHSKVLQEGVLTQLGGDCHAWRRRLFKLQGNRLVPYSEVTKKASVEIDLALALDVYDSNAALLSPAVPQTPGSTRTAASSYDDEDELARMDNEFRITFKGTGGELRFFADNEQDKQRWLEVLGKVVGQKGKKPAPQWAVTLRKLQQKQAAQAALEA